MKITASNRVHSDSSASEDEKDADDTQEQPKDANTELGGSNTDAQVTIHDAVQDGNDADDKQNDPEADPTPRLMVPNADTTVTIEAASDPVVNSQEYRENAYTRFVGKIQNAVYRFFSDSADLLWKIFYLVLLLLYVVYFLGAMIYKFGDEGSVRLLVVTLIVAVYFLHRLVSRRVTRSKAKTRFLGSCWARAGRLRDRLDIILIVLMVVFAIIYIGYEVAKHKPSHLTSAGGLLVFLLLSYIFSTNPAKVQWRPVILGVLLQFILGVVILRTQWGYASFQYLGERVTHFLSYTDAGSRFLFGDEYKVHFMAFRVLPTVVFFSAFVSMMYYLGFMQFLIRNVGRFLAFCLGTSPAESVVAAANIFIGMTEAPLMVRPLVANMTRSEIHAILTCGFATIAGGVMAAYMQFDITAHHLLSASVMSAPAALAVAKLFYPETETIKIEAKDVMKSEKRSERNIIEAASNGASQSIALVANIAVNLIAFVALLDGINATLIWFGERVGMHDPKLTFQLVCSYLFYPLSVLMGVDAKDRLVLGELIGTKTFLNEFVAYLDLSVYIKNKEKLAEYMHNFTLGLPTHPTGTWNYTNGGILLHDTGVFLQKGILADRSVMVATYALCGFSNFGSMGMMIGALGAMAPARVHDISGLVFRAMIAGNMACFMTACIAGLLSSG